MNAQIPVIVDHPLQSVTSVFWVAITCSFVNLILVLFVFPESLPASRRASNRKGKGRAVASGPEFPSSTCHTSLATIVFNSRRPIGKAEEPSHGWVATRIIRSFLSPLAVFLPSRVPVATSATGDSLVPTRTRKDWGLTFIGISLFAHMLATGIFQLKYLYAEHIYDWAAEQLSYYISFMGACRAWHLLVFLPCESTFWSHFSVLMISSPSFEVQARPRCGFLHRCTRESCSASIKAQTHKVTPVQ